MFPKTQLKISPWTSVTKKNKRKSTGCANNTSNKSLTVKNKCSKSKRNNLAVLPLKRKMLALKDHCQRTHKKKVQESKKNPEKTHKTSQSIKIKLILCPSPKKYTNLSASKIGIRAHYFSKKRACFSKKTNIKWQTFTR
jgi:hypothetical protein